MQLTEQDVAAAQSVFHQPPLNANCAQSVALLAGRDDLVEPFRACGGGRAPEGLCGALHAALALCPEERREEIIAAFREAAGATTCRELKGACKTPCVHCVAIGDKLRASFS